DIKMPGRSGLDFLPEIRAQYPNTAVVMVTAVTETDLINECIRKGAIDYFTKPFDLDEVLRLIERISTDKLKPFHSVGSITQISRGEVQPIHETHRWRVTRRVVCGHLEGDISGDYTITYSADIDSLETQSGTLSGVLAVAGGSYALDIEGRIQPLEVLKAAELPPKSGHYVPILARLTIKGYWTFTTGLWGRGSFDAVVNFIPTPDGHVGRVVDSEFIMAGQFVQPKVLASTVT
ncbi:MAG: response regulator, partial [Chloroflexota bacterium]